jgi:hypothetical protein
MRFWGKSSVVAVLGLSYTLAIAQAPQQQPTAKRVSAKRANELTLAGLRPGVDTINRAEKLYQRIRQENRGLDGQSVWLDDCRHQLLAVDFDAGRKIQVIRASELPLSADCVALPSGPWKTELGLRVGDPPPKVAQLYGEPDSKSPSSKNGQQLELWYYAFDWAGADVPQVMEVLCTKEKDGKPGRVIEITLAAPSL